MFGLKYSKNFLLYFHAVKKCKAKYNFIAYSLCYTVHIDKLNFPLTHVQTAV